MTGDTVVIRLPLAAAEALADAQEGEAEGWPDDWPDHAEAFAVALQAVEDALSQPEPEHHCACCTGRRRTQLDHEEHHRLLAASQAPEVEFAAISATLHGLDCHVARAHSPLVVEPGGWRTKKLPTYLTAAEAVVWFESVSQPSSSIRCRIPYITGERTPERLDSS